MSLRVALLLIGAALVAAIWLWGKRRRGGRYHVYGARRSAGRRRLRIRDPEVGAAAALEHAADDPAMASTVEPPELDPHESPLAQRDDAEGVVRHRAQLELGLDAAARRVEEHAAAPQPDVIVVNVEVDSSRRIRGQELLAAMRAVGMQYGAMQIFHHYGVGQLRAAAPLFSLANLFEPGVFDMARMDAFETRGLSLFMRRPTAIDDKVAFELLLNTGQRLADIFAAQLTDASHRALDAAAIDALRKRVGAT